MCRLCVMEDLNACYTMNCDTSYSFFFIHSIKEEITVLGKDRFTHTFSNISLNSTFVHVNIYLTVLNRSGSSSVASASPLKQVIINISIF